MHVSDIPKRIGHTRTTVLLGGSLVAMVIFGFVLANVDRDRLTDSLSRANNAITTLRAENAKLQRSQSQLQVQFELERMRAEQLKDEVVSLQANVFRLQKDKAFYQHVVAPETNQDGFFIEGLELTTLDNQLLKGSMVLLQQRAVKAMVKGTLHLDIIGSLKGQHTVLKSTQHTFLPEGEIAFGFKYFQAVTFYLQLPENFSPEVLRFHTTVYQYNRQRGDYEREYRWQDIVAPS